MDNKQIENLIWHIEENREVCGDTRILNDILKSLKNANRKHTNFASTIRKCDKND